MKKISFSIAKSTILENVALNSAYAGAKADDNTVVFDKVATIREDDTLLSNFFMEMCALLIDKLKAFIASSSLEDSRLDVTLELSNAFDESLSSSIIKDLSAAVSIGVTAHWFRYTLPARAGEWEKLADDCLSRAISKLCQRRRPTRTT